MIHTPDLRRRRQQQLADLIEDFDHRYADLRATRAARAGPTRPSMDYRALESAVLAIRTSAWYQDFKGAREVASAIHDLEEHFRRIVSWAAAGKSPLALHAAREEAQHSEEVEQDLRAQLLENELWFRRLYAQVVGIDEQGTAVPSLRDRVEGRTRFGRAATSLRVEATRLLFRDRELLAALRHADRKFLEELPTVLSALEESLKEARRRIEAVDVDGQGRPVRPRASRGARQRSDSVEAGETDGRELVRYLVEVCMKTYLHCDLAVMKKLVSYPLSSAGYLRGPALMALIEKTADRKLTNAAHWNLNEQDMLDIASRHDVPIGMVIDHWLGVSSQ